MKISFLAFGFMCVFLSVPGWSVTITPSNVTFPTAPGGLFSFDFAVNSVQSFSAQAFQCTVDVSGPAALTLDSVASVSIAASSSYWLFADSGGANAFAIASDSYQFGDNPDSGAAHALVVDDIVARYTFVWDGTEGDYTFAFDPNTSKSFITDESFNNIALEFSPGGYNGDSMGFTVYIPEPATLFLFGLGTAMLTRRRR